MTIMIWSSLSWLSPFLYWLWVSNISLFGFIIIALVLRCMDCHVQYGQQVVFCAYYFLTCVSSSHTLLSCFFVMSRLSFIFIIILLLPCWHTNHVPWLIACAINFIALDTFSQLLHVHIKHLLKITMLNIYWTIQILFHSLKNIIWNLQEYYNHYWMLAQENKHFV